MGRWADAIGDGIGGFDWFRAHRHLQVQRFPELGKQFYFFNSFFFKKLSDSYPLKRVEGEEPYEKLKKWTRNVNIFEYEFLIIPVNER